MRTIWFDMDGTIANLYGVENWLPKLQAHDASPYADAKVMWNMNQLARLLNRVQAIGYGIGIISWLSKCPTEDYDKAVEASQILFGGGSADALRSLDEATMLDVFAGVPTFEFSISENMGARLADLMVDKAPVFPSKGEMRKLVQNNGFSVNKVKITDPNATLTEDMLLGGKYVLVQKGKKNYVLLIGLYGVMK